MTALKCPICGAPVPPSKGVKPRKFCSKKCTQKAADRYRTERGGGNEKTCRRTCAFCGAVFMSRGNGQRFCSRSCAMSARSAESVNRLKENRELKRRQAESCRETAPITVDCVRTTDGRTLVVETRGQRCIGWRSAGHVSHS